MRQNHCFSMQKQTPLRPKYFFTSFQNDFIFQSSNYPFPDDLQACRKYKSFKTDLELNKWELADPFTKKLSMLNRSYFTIKLKQVMKEDMLQNKRPARLLLYYESIPFSMQFVKYNPFGNLLSASRLQKILQETISDLIEFNIYYELTLSNCGFTQQGQFRIYVPPSFIIYQAKLSTSEKQSMLNSSQLIVQYWQSDLPQKIKTPDREYARFNSPELKRDVLEDQTREHKNSEQQMIDVKKTIKLSKNYVKELCSRIEEQKTKTSGLKKHKSLEWIIKAEPKACERKSYHFAQKINELNKKLSSIRETFIRSKQSTEQPNDIQASHLKKKNSTQLQNCEESDQQYHQYYEQVIFNQQDQENLAHNPQFIHHNPFPTFEHQVNTEQIDPFKSELREKPLKPFTQVSEMRKTALPILTHETKRFQQKKLLNHNQLATEKFAPPKFIQPCLEEVNEDKGVTSLSKIQQQPKKQTNFQRQKSICFEVSKKESRLKKMISLDTFESELETKSVHLSQYSKDLPNVKRREEKQIRNQEIKEKIQDILLKSKKAIQLLKTPFKTSL